MRTTACVLALSLSSLSFLWPGHIGATQQPQFRADTDVVQLDVSVFDKDRRPVRALTQADFTILADGRPQPIVAFAPVEIAEPVTPPSAWMRDVPADVVTNDLTTRRVIVIVFDDAHMPVDPRVIDNAKHIAKDAVDRLGPDDLAAVTFTLSGKRQDVTRDRQRLRAAIDALAPHPNLLKGPPPCSYYGRLRSMAGCVMDTFLRVAEALATAPSGRKTLVYISSGVPFNFSAANFDSGDEMYALRTLFASLQQANVNVYAVDPTGLTTEGIGGPRLDGLRIMAENTGGRATVASNVPWEAVPQIFLENSSYYLVGFRSTGTAAGSGFHKVEVAVNRPGVDVRTRSGYFTTSPDAAAKQPTAPLSPTEQALRVGLSGGDLTFGVTVAPFFVPGRREATVAISVGLTEATADRKPHEAVRVKTVALDSNGRESGGSEQTLDFSFPANAGPEFRYDILSKLLVRPGQYQVRVVTEVQGKAGSVFADLDVPDFAKAPLSLSGLVLSTEPPRPSASGAHLEELLPVVPTTLREFRRPMRVTAFLRLYQGGSRPLSAIRLTASIVDEAGKTNFEQTALLDSSHFSVARSADCRLELPLPGLAPGGHLLTIEAALGGMALQRRARFSIQP